MASSSSETFVPAGADMDMARGLGSRELRINIVNSGKKMIGVPALFSNSGEKCTVCFRFDDVRGTLEVDGEQASGIFDSGRDNGRYEATLSSTSARGVRCYAGKWFNNKHQSGGFQFEMPQVPRPLALGTNRTLQMPSVQSLIQEAHDLANGLGQSTWSYGTWKQYHMLNAPHSEKRKFFEILGKIRSAYRQDPKQTLDILNREAGGNGVTTMKNIFKDTRQPHVTVMPRKSRPPVEISFTKYNSGDHCRTSGRSPLLLWKGWLVLKVNAWPLKQLGYAPGGGGGFHVSLSAIS